MTLEKPIGLLGGTFDPVHNGHLAIANHVLHTLKLAQIDWIPCYLPAHRNMPVASALDRLAMVKLATQNNPKFIVNDCEIKRGGVSYMVDTLVHLRAQHPSTPFCLILGVDAFAKLNFWHRWGELLSLTHLVVINRPGAQLPDSVWMHDLLKHHQAKKIDQLHQSLAGSIYFDTINPIAISATQIRRQVSKGKTPSCELPEAVRAYIQSHRIYMA